MKQTTASEPKAAQLFCSRSQGKLLFTDKRLVQLQPDPDKRQGRAQDVLRIHRFFLAYGEEPDRDKGK